MEPGMGSTACRSHAVDVNGTADELHGRVFAEGGHAAGLYLYRVCVGTCSGRCPAEDARVCETALKSVMKACSILSQTTKRKVLFHFKVTESQQAEEH